MVNAFFSNTEEKTWLYTFSNRSYSISFSILWWWFLFQQKEKERIKRKKFGICLKDTTRIRTSTSKRNQNITSFWVNSQTPTCPNNKEDKNLFIYFIYWIDSWFKMIKPESFFISFVKSHWDCSLERCYGSLQPAYSFLVAIEFPFRFSPRNGGLEGQQTLQVRTR